MRVGIICGANIKDEWDYVKQDYIDCMKICWNDMVWWIYRKGEVGIAR